MTLLVRPYPVDALAEAREALANAATGDLAALRALYVRARDQLHALDPDEVRDPVRAHPEAGSRDKAALKAAADVADTWEGVVAVAATIEPLPRLRGFLMACATFRYLDVEDPELSAFKAWCRGDWLPGLSPEDSVLYAALPALLGLGPELPDELRGPAPVEGEAVWSLLGLPEDDWEGADPLDGFAISAETCAAAYPSATGTWRGLLARGATEGLLLRGG